MAEGRIDGLKPGETFDRLLYGPQHPQMGGVNPLVDAIVRYAGSVMPVLLLNALRERHKQLDIFVSLP